MRNQALLPRCPVPALNVALTTGERFVLGAATATHFDMVVFSRGLHCPICAKYLLELERLAPEFAQRGVNLIAVSSDDLERGQLMADKVKASGVKMGYGLSLKRPKNGVSTSARAAAKPQLALKSLPCSASLAYFWCAPMARCTTAPFKPCRSHGHPSRTCSARLISLWRKTTPRAVNSLVRSEPMRSARVMVLTTLAKLAFAGDTVLCRLALKHTGIDPATFTSVRLMMAAGVAWGVYSLRGKGSGDATQTTGGNFQRAAVLTFFLSAFTLPQANLDSTGLA